MLKKSLVFVFTLAVALMLSPVISGAVTEINTGAGSTESVEGSGFDVVTWWFDFESAWNDLIEGGNDPEQDVSWAPNQITSKFGYTGYMNADALEWQGNKTDTSNTNNISFPLPALNTMDINTVYSFAYTASVVSKHNHDQSLIGTNHFGVGDDGDYHEISNAKLSNMFLANISQNPDGTYLFTPSQSYSKVFDGMQHSKKKLDAMEASVTGIFSVKKLSSTSYYLTWRMFRPERFVFKWWNEAEQTWYKYTKYALTDEASGRYLKSSVSQTVPDDVNLMGYRMENYAGTSVTVSPQSSYKSHRCSLCGCTMPYSSARYTVVPYYTNDPADPVYIDFMRAYINDEKMGSYTIVGEPPITPPTNPDTPPPVEPSDPDNPWGDGSVDETATPDDTSGGGSGGGGGGAGGGVVEPDIDMPDMPLGVQGFLDSLESRFNIWRSHFDRYFKIFRIWS